FFQAEDGIRDGHVTGVQTCALPIFGSISRARGPYAIGGDRLLSEQGDGAGLRQVITSESTSDIALASRSSGPSRSERGSATCTRSEERRVGKECRSRCAAELVVKET